GRLKGSGVARRKPTFAVLAHGSELAEAEIPGAALQKMQIVPRTVPRLRRSHPRQHTLDHFHEQQDNLAKSVLADFGAQFVYPCPVYHVFSPPRAVASAVCPRALTGPLMRAAKTRCSGDLKAPGLI